MFESIVECSVVVAHKIKSTHPQRPCHAVAFSAVPGGRKTSALG